MPNEPVFSFFEASPEQYYVNYEPDFAFDKEILNVSMTKPRYSDLGEPGLRIELRQINYSEGV